jgi:uncharacterized membrane protein YjdF
MKPNNTTLILAILFWPALVFLVHVLASAVGVYAQIDKFDNVMHFLGGASIAAAAGHALALARRRGWMTIQRRALTLLVVLGMVALAAVCWEFLEFIMDRYASTGMQGDIIDTLSDMLLALVGGLIIALTYRTKDARDI